MRSVLLYLFFSGFMAISTSEKFRPDYNYYPDIGGWMKLHVPTTFMKARERCYREGAILASPENKEMQKALSREMNLSSVDCAIFTGVHSTFSPGYFYSLEGVPLYKMPVQWSQGGPDNAGNNENCIAYISDGTVADVNCSETLPFVCYKKKTDNMNLLPCGTDDREYEYYKETGSCYKYHKNRKLWHEAFLICSTEGGYLAIINSKYEAEILKNIRAKSNDTSTTNVYLGFRDWDDHRQFKTVHGQTLKEAGYDAWEAGEPNGQFCGAMYHNGLLDDRVCDVPATFICELDPSWIN